MANLTSSDLTRVMIDQIGFKKTPVDIDTFLDDPYYLGGYIHVYPYWRKKLRELFPNNLMTSSSYVVFTGAIGIGKSSIAKIIMAYDVYKMSLLNDPVAFYHADFKKGHHIKCFNVTKDKAWKTAVEYREMFFNGEIPYFRDELKYGNKILCNLHIDAASKLKHLISDDVLGFVLSELNDASTKVAKEVMSEAEGRIWARYRSGKNFMNHLILDSTARNEGSVIDDFLANSPLARDAFKIRAAHWEAKEGLGMYGNHGYFDLYLGDSNNKPRILRKGENISNLDPDQVMKVPMEYYDEVSGANREAMNAFIQNICGRSTVSAYKFITEDTIITDAQVIPWQSEDIISVDFYEEDDTIYDKLKYDIIDNIPSDRKLFIGLDCGVATDLFGLAIAYADGVKRFNTTDGGGLDLLNICVPIAVGISRYEDQETPINKVHDFILKLNEDYEIGGVFMDQYQSTEVKQILIQNGLNAEIISIDRDDSAYVTFKRYLTQNLIKLPKNNRLTTELSKLNRVQQGDTNKFKVSMDRDGVSHGDMAAAVVQVVSQMIILGPEITLNVERTRTTHLADIYENISKTPRLIRSMI